MIDVDLCWELVSKRGGSWILHYVKSAYAVTDVPDQVRFLRTGTDFTTSSLAERLVLRRGPLHLALLLYLPLGAQLHPEILDTRRDVLPALQLDLQLVRFGAPSPPLLANYYIAFVILSTSLEQADFNLKGINVANIILNYFYLGLLILCFLLSLGNRPQGSKWGYTAAFVGFGVITIYMTFANVHDVSWGTKGDNKVSTDLGVVTTGKNKNEVEVNVPTAETDINAAYEDAIQLLSSKPPKVDSKPDAATQQEDYYRTFRTNTTTNKDSNNAGVKGYMAFLLYSVAGLACKHHQIPLILKATDPTSQLFVLLAQLFTWSFGCSLLQCPVVFAANYVV
ncbi:glycosyltransferase family protein [Salix suchowensis]|nr:glycosyltransferase family protein [Salix suchowensis]